MSDKEYPAPSLTVDPVVFTVADNDPDNYKKLPAKELRVLLIKRARPPFQGEWALPGGFVEVGREIQAEVQRELFEETNIDNIYLEQLYTWGDLTRFDPDKGDPTPRDEREHVISVSYLSLIDSGRVHLKAGDDAADARWFTVADELTYECRVPGPDGYVLDQRYRLTLSSGDLLLSAIVRKKTTVSGKVMSEQYTLWECAGIAFDHAKFIYYSLIRLRGKLEYMPIAFNLMPELFTLTELRRVYEIIQKREIADAYFRNKFRPRLVETNQKRTGAGHANATLYRFDPLRWEQTEPH